MQEDETVDFKGVKVQGHTTPKLDLETWFRSIILDPIGRV